MTSPRIPCQPPLCPIPSVRAEKSRTRQASALNAWNRLMRKCLSARVRYGWTKPALATASFLPCFPRTSGTILNQGHGQVHHRIRVHSVVAAVVALRHQKFCRVQIRRPGSPRNESAGVNVWDRNSYDFQQHSPHSQGIDRPRRGACYFAQPTEWNSAKILLLCQDGEDG